MGAVGHVATEDLIRSRRHLNANFGEVHRVNAAALAIQRAHRGHVARMCSFLSDTHVLSVNAYGIHDFMPVSALDRGSKVLAFNGEEIEVTCFLSRIVIFVFCL